MKLKPLNIILILFVLLPSFCVHAQNESDFGSKKMELKGTWISQTSSPDTLMFYLDGKGVDCAVYGHDGLIHGYFVEMKNNCIILEGLCDQKRRKWKFKTQMANNLLIVEDFYRNTNEDVVFTKISSEVK